MNKFLKTTLTKIKNGFMLLEEEAILIKKLAENQEWINVQMIRETSKKLLAKILMPSVLGLEFLNTFYRLAKAGITTWRIGIVISAVGGGIVYLEELGVYFGKKMKQGVEWVSEFINGEEKTETPKMSEEEQKKLYATPPSEVLKQLNDSIPQLKLEIYEESVKIMEISNEEKNKQIAESLMGLNERLEKTFNVEFEPYNDATQQKNDTIPQKNDTIPQKIKTIPQKNDTLPKIKMPTKM